MTRIITLTLVLALLFSSCNSQTTDQKTKTELIEKALQKWADNPSFKNDQLDLAIIKQLQDSGEIVNGLKGGLWTEHSLDTSSMGKEFGVSIGDKKTSVTLSATLQKEVGNYLKGKRDGIWILYKSYDKKLPLYWERNTVTNYKDGLKDGEEVTYQGYGTDQTPLIVENWKQGILNGIGKIYNNNYPFKLLKLYYTVDSNSYMIEQYFPSGQLQIVYTDTVLKDNKLKYFKEFFESGQLKMTGYYLNGEHPFGTWTSFYDNGKIEDISNYVNSKRDGSYKYFHNNGQLWTERIYKNGRLLSVVSNFDKHGKKQDPGTIKNGTGNLYYYNDEGQLTESVEYLDGQIKGSR